MLESFLLNDNLAIENAFLEKKLLASEVLGKSPRRSLRPDLLLDRCRLDVMWNGKNLGIRGPTLENGRFEFFILEKPQSASLQIQQLMSFWMETPPPSFLTIAQVRFRSGLDGIQGLWIDTSNENIHRLLEEGHWLFSLIDKGIVVEVGQKHKEVGTDPTRGLRLNPSTLRCWLQGFDKNNDPIELVSSVSHFSQPGPEANRILVAGALDLLDAFELPAEISWIEWGAGYGNFTPFLASRLGSRFGRSLELDPSLSAALERNRTQFFPSIKTHARPAESGPESDWESANLWFIDPPRPGFGSLLTSLSGPHFPRPKWVLAFHCHTSGLISDSTALKSSGYKLLDWLNADVFPATPHQEVISLWQIST